MNEEMNMTTDNPQPANSAPLTEKDLEALKEYSETGLMRYRMFTPLQASGYVDNEGKITTLGKQVLAATQASAPDGAKPATVTAGDWPTVAEDVKAGRCIVEEVLKDFDGEKRYLVNNIVPRKGNVFDVTYPWFTCVNVEPDKQFTVTWQPIAPAAASAPVDGGGELTAKELETLEWCDLTTQPNNGYQHFGKELDSLATRGLVYQTGFNSWWLTAKGKEVRKQALAAQTKTEAGWYYSSVAQWIPEYSTEKINGYDGPFPTWGSALEALFKELDKDTEVLRDQLQHEQATVKGLVKALKPFAKHGEYLISIHDPIENAVVMNWQTNTPVLTSFDCQQAAAALQGVGGVNKIGNGSLVEE